MSFRISDDRLDSPTAGPPVRDLLAGLHARYGQPEAITWYTSAGDAPIEPYGVYRSSPLSRRFARTR